MATLGYRPPAEDPFKAKVGTGTPLTFAPPKLPGPPPGPPPPPPPQQPPPTPPGSPITPISTDGGMPPMPAKVAGHPQAKDNPLLDQAAAPSGVTIPHQAVTPTEKIEAKAKQDAADKAAADKAAYDKSYEGQAANMWTSMMADYDASLGGKLQQTYGDEARAGRSADVQSAMMGRGVGGGGYQAGQAQVALGGMSQRQDVLNQHTKQGLQMKLTYLDTLIKRAEASKDRALQEKLQAEADKTLLTLQGAGIDPTSYTGEASQETVENGPMSATVHRDADGNRIDADGNLIE